MQLRLILASLHGGLSLGCLHTQSEKADEGPDQVVLTLKAPPIICSRRQFQILPLFQKLQIRHDIS